MSDSLHRTDEELAEFALRGLDGPARAEVLAHLEHCERCRQEATGFASTLDLLLLAVPAAAPAPGLAARVDAALPLADERLPARLDGSKPRRPDARLRRRVLLATAALVLVVAGVTGLIASRPSQPGVRTATMVDSVGTPMGRVVLTTHRATIIVTRPDGYAPLTPSETYRLRVVPRSGAAPPTQPFHLGADGAWSGALGLVPSDVTRVEVVDPGGRVVCRARFSDA